LQDSLKESRETQNKIPPQVKVALLFLLNLVFSVNPVNVANMESTLQSLSPI